MSSLPGLTGDKPAHGQLRVLNPNTNPASENHRFLEYRDPNEVRIYVDNDPTVGYNSRWFVRHVLSWWFHLIPHLLPERLVKFLFVGTSHHIGQIVEYRTGWQALHQIYNHRRPTQEAQMLPEMLHLPPEKHWWNSLMANFWETVVVYGAGTRNRFRMVKKLSRQRFALVTQRPILILSIGSGSSQALLEAIWEESRQCPDKRFRLHALDLSRDALSNAAALTGALGLPKETLVNKRCNIVSVDKLLQTIGDCRYDLIEVVGFSEYRPFGWSVELARALNEHLEPGGVLLFNNARPNREAWFTRKIMDWPLDLKEPKVLRDIMLAAGFVPGAIDIIGEPTKTFWMARAIKEG